MVATLITAIGGGFEPVTLEGRLVTLLLVVWALGVFGYVTAAVASYFVGKDASESPDSELRALRREVAELRTMLAESLERRSGT